MKQTNPKARVKAYIQPKGICHRVARRNQRWQIIAVWDIQKIFDFRRLLFYGDMRNRAQAHGGGQQAIADIAAAVPMQRLAKPVEVGELFAFLGSDEASYLTGSQVVIDGGSTLPETMSMGIG